MKNIKKENEDFLKELLKDSEDRKPQKPAGNIKKDDVIDLRKRSKEHDKNRNK